jgi:hypothetical protein
MTVSNTSTCMEACYERLVGHIATALRQDRRKVTETEVGSIQCQGWLGGLLNHYCRPAA